MKQYDRNLKRWRNERGQFISREKVSIIDTFFYNSALKRYVDKESNKIISNNEALNRLTVSGKSKVWVKSKKTGKFYKDNKKAERTLKQQLVKSRKKTVKKYKKIQVTTQSIDITDYIHIYEDKYFYFTPGLSKILISFVKENKISQHSEQRFYVYSDIDKTNEETDETITQTLGSIQLTDEDLADESKYKELLKDMIETYVNEYTGSINYDDIISGLIASGVLKSW